MTIWGWMGGFSRAWGGALCTVCRWVILIGDAPKGCQLKFTCVVHDYPWGVGTVAFEMPVFSGTSGLAERMKGLCGPCFPCL